MTIAPRPLLLDEPIRGDQVGIPWPKRPWTFTHHSSHFVRMSHSFLVAAFNGSPWCDSVNESWNHISISACRLHKWQ